MNHRRSVAALAILAAVSFAACGEADSDPAPIPNAAQPEAQAASAGGQLSADAAEHWANLEAQAASAGGQLSADAAEHWASVEVNVQRGGIKAR